MEPEAPEGTEEVVLKEVETPKAVVLDEEEYDDLKKTTEIDYDNITTDPPMRATVVGPLNFNHVTSFIGIAVLWGISTWCMVDSEGAREKLVEWRGDTAQYFSWFYIGTRPLFFFFIIYVAVVYGDIRLGPKGAKPQFSTLTYFTMLFAAGVAVGLFFYGVSEPLWHRSSHWYSNAGYRSQDEKDQFAITITLYHWGLAAWAGYILVALCIGLAAYRFNLPMTFRSGLYPILGAYTWGWIGDFIDGFTIVVTVAGVCTSLGLGAMQIQQGMERVGWVEENPSEDSARNIQVAVIWVITLIATVSVVSGLEVGIKHLSNFAFILGQILLFWVFVADQTEYLLNLIVQSTGHYLHYSTWWLNFWVDAFGQLRDGEGRTQDGTPGALWWFDAWTIFYMAWWTSWSGFVGLFVARISKGRTLRDVCIMGTIVPMMYSIIWFCIFGGVGLRQARQADEMKQLGLDVHGDSAYYQNSELSYCYDVPQESVVVDGEIKFENHLVGVTPVCEFNSGDANNAWFNVLFSFTYPNDFDIGFGYVFSIVSIFAISIYFITSSDSGSLIVDHLASNGKEEHFWGQRIFWAFTEGAVATALLVAGGSEALQALQAASILSGLPFSLVMCYMIQSTIVMCEQAKADEDSMELRIDTVDSSVGFKTPVFGGIFNIFEYLVSFTMVHDRRVELGIALPTRAQAVGFIMYIFLPFIGIHKVLAAHNPKGGVGNMVTVGFYALCFLLWVGLYIATAASDGIRVFGWTVYFACGVTLTGIKHDFREKHNLRGNIVGDFISSTFVYPQVIYQLVEQCEVLELPKSDD